MYGNRKFDLEERSIDFSVKVLNALEKLPNTKAANHIGGQAIRSCSSPSLNYGEAVEAESRNDFIHKMGVCRKELGETKNALKILIRKPYPEILPDGEEALKECLELIRIFSKSMATAKKNGNDKRKN